MHTMHLNCIKIYFLILLLLEKKNLHVNDILRILNKREIEKFKNY